MQNKQVVKNWRLGIKGRSSNGFLHTDGNNLYSWDLRIGLTFHGKKIALDLCAPHSPSHTTTHHSSLAKQVCDQIDQPMHYQGYGYFSWCFNPNHWIIDKGINEEFQTMVKQEKHAFVLGEITDQEVKEYQHKKSLENHNPFKDHGNLKSALPFDQENHPLPVNEFGGRYDPLY